MSRAARLTLSLALLGAGVIATGAGRPQDFAAEIAKFRAERNDLMGRQPTSPISLVHREYLEGRSPFVIGSSQQSHLRLPGAGVAAKHATIESANGRHILRAHGKQVISGVSQDAPAIVEAILNERPQFRIGGYALNFRPGGLAQGPAIDVYDLQSPGKAAFRALAVFPPDAAYRVTAHMKPLATPQRITLTDSQGFDRPYWIYGHLSFRIAGKDLQLEVYTPTLDRAQITRERFMLMFGDLTNGRETYKLGRYLYIEPEFEGPVTVDFNRAQSPPCNFSAAFTCPFPRKQNRLPIAIPAGEKNYAGPMPRLLVEESK